MQELVHQNHLLCIQILSWYSNSYATERISKRIEYLFQLYYGIVSVSRKKSNFEDNLLVI